MSFSFYNISFTNNHAEIVSIEEWHDIVLCFGRECYTVAEGRWQGEIWNKRKSDEEYLQLLSISAVKDDSDDVVRYVGTFSDITEIS